jgi:hypothetical protein
MRERIERRREEGVALVTTMLILVLLTTIGMASLETTAADRRVGGFLSRAQMALYAAEAGLQSAMRSLTEADLPSGAAALENVNIPVPSTAVGDSSLHPYGAPSFAADETATQPVSYLGAGGPCEEWLMSIELGGPRYLYSLWDLRVKGETSDGARSRVQASATRCYAYDG